MRVKLDRVERVGEAALRQLPLRRGGLDPSAGGARSKVEIVLQPPLERAGQ